MVLKHPHILKLIEVIRRTVNENKQFTLIYEFTEVGNALDYFLKKKKVYENDVAIVAKNILLSLSYLHDNKMVHGLVQPQNFFISDEETCYKKL